MNIPTKRKFLQTVDLAYIGMFVAIISVCSWISIPAAVPFSLQTFAIFLAIGLLGGKRGTIAVSTYILLGAIGLPVFSGFKGGIGTLLGATGGYLVGFIFASLIIWLITDKLGKSTRVLLLSMAIGLITCYTFGTIWFLFIYTTHTGTVGIISVLTWCVFPFIIPDICKIALALVLTKRLARHIQHEKKV